MSASDHRYREREERHGTCHGAGGAQKLLISPYGRPGRPASWLLGAPCASDVSVGLEAYDVAVMLSVTTVLTLAFVAAETPSRSQREGRWTHWLGSNHRQLSGNGLNCWGRECRPPRQTALRLIESHAHAVVRTARWRPTVLAKEEERGSEPKPHPKRPKLDPRPARRWKAFPRNRRISLVEGPCAGGAA